MSIEIYCEEITFSYLGKDGRTTMRVANIKKAYQTSLHGHMAIILSDGATFGDGEVRSWSSPRTFMVSRMSHITVSTFLIGDKDDLETTKRIDHMDKFRYFSETLPHYHRLESGSSS